MSASKENTIADVLFRMLFSSGIPISQKIDLTVLYEKPVEQALKPMEQTIEPMELVPTALLQRYKNVFSRAKFLRTRMTRKKKLMNKECQVMLQT